MQRNHLESSRLGVAHDHPEADQIARAGGDRRLCSRRMPKFNMNYSSPRMRAASAIGVKFGMRKFESEPRLPLAFTPLTIAMHRQLFRSGRPARRGFQPLRGAESRQHAAAPRAKRPQR
jgi:hypothetical protein